MQIGIDMSVIIRNMEFPNFCMDCPLKIKQDGFIYCPISDSHISERLARKQKMKKCSLENYEEQNSSMPNLLC